MLSHSTGTMPELPGDCLQLYRDMGATCPSRLSPGGRISVRDSAFPCILLLIQRAGHKGPRPVWSPCVWHGHALAFPGVHGIGILACG